MAVVVMAMVVVEWISWLVGCDGWCFFFFFFGGGGCGFVGLRRKMCECEFVGGERERERGRMNK